MLFCFLNTRNLLRQSLAFLSALAIIKGVQYILVQGILIPTLSRLHSLISLLLRENSLGDQFCAALLDSAYFKRLQIDLAKGPVVLPGR